MDTDMLGDLDAALAALGAEAGSDDAARAAGEAAERFLRRHGRALRDRLARGTGHGWRPISADDVERAARLDCAPLPEDVEVDDDELRRGIAERLERERCVPTPPDQAHAEGRGRGAPLTFDIEALLRDCVQAEAGGDPRRMAEAIRAWFAALSHRNAEEPVGAAGRDVGRGDLAMSRSGAARGPAGTKPYVAPPAARDPMPLRPISEEDARRVAGRFLAEDIDAALVGRMLEALRSAFPDGIATRKP